MKPSRLLLIWLAILLAIGIVLGTLRALDIALPSSLLSIQWGLLLALLALAIPVSYTHLTLPTICSV